MINEKLLKDIDWNFTSSKTNKYTHDYHPYHAKFIPQIPRKFLDFFTEEGDTVLDPFCGSGTTLIEGLVMNRNVLGIDASPLAHLMSKVKTTRIEINKLNTIFEEFQIRFKKNKDKNLLLIPEFPNKEQWFSEENLKTLGYIWCTINEYKFDEEVFDFLRLGFSSILKTVANDRYKWNWTFIGDNVLPNQIKVSDVYNIFLKKIKSMIIAMDELNNKWPTDVKAKVFFEDTKRIKEYITGKVDLIITSPPYPFAVDFNRYYRLSYYWFGWPIEEYKDIEIGARSKRGRKNAVDIYFEEIEKIYKLFYEVLKEEKYFCLTIGNTSRQGKKVDIINKTTEICVSLGFKLVEKFDRDLSKQSMPHKRIPTENVIIFKKVI